VNAATIPSIDLSVLKGAGQVKRSGSFTSNASELYRAASELLERARDIEHNWHDFSEAERLAYRALAYHAVESTPGLMERVRFKFRMMRLPEDALLQYRTAVFKFLNTILDKAEEENAAYQQKICDVLDEFNPSNAIVVTKENAVERLRELSS
jgi:hypothetical protein